MVKKIIVKKVEKKNDRNTLDVRSVSSVDDDSSETSSKAMGRGQAPKTDKAKLNYLVKELTRIQGWSWGPIGCAVGLALREIGEGETPVASGTGREKVKTKKISPKQDTSGTKPKKKFKIKKKKQGA